MSKQSAKWEAEEQSRLWATAAFVGVIVVIGVPLWWKTTEVYRVSLPYNEIAALDPQSHVIRTDLEIFVNDEQTAAELVSQVKKGFEDSDVIKLKITESVLSLRLQFNLLSAADEADAVEEVSEIYGLDRQNTFYLIQKKNLSKDVWLGTQRVMFFRDIKSSSTVVEALKKWVYQTKIVSAARADTADMARRIRLPPAPAYRILVHVAYVYSLDEQIDDYLGSFLDELSDLHNFTLKTQTLYMLNFDFQQQMVSDKDGSVHFAVRENILHMLLTRLEERAATRVPEQPSLNLALLAVPCHVAPLVLYPATGKPNRAPIQAFFSPKWGGVVLTNPSQDECEGGEWKPDVKLIMGTFISQLRKLIGIVEAEPIKGAHIEPLRSVSPRKWEIDSLLRIRTLEQLTSAERTLQSLAQLLGEISNIVINDDVGNSINLAIDNIKKGSALARSGDLIDAYKHSQTGSVAAETAFSDPSLLALLYFPDDQKYAIYIPLFLPVMFPIILSLKIMILWMRGKPIRKEKAD